MHDLSQVFDRAAELHRKGELAAAEGVYLQLLERRPDHFNGLHMLGFLRQQQGRFSEALSLIDKALALKPVHAEALNSRGLVLLGLRRLAEALTSFDRALAIRPHYVAALNNRGNILQELNRPAEALASYERALTIQPTHVQALYNRGIVLRELQRNTEALASFDRVLAIRPDHADALNNRGIVLRDLKRPAEALASYERALVIRPHYVDALNNRGIALQELQRLTEALASHDAALALDPTNADTLCCRGAVLRDLKRFAEALASFEQALAINPGHRYAFAGMVFSALAICDWERTAIIAGELEARIEQRSSIIPPFALVGYCDDESLLLSCAKNYVKDCILVPPRPLWRGARWHNEKLKIAYVSADFRRHAVAFCMAELVELHDRSQFEVIGVSLGPDDHSDLRMRLVAAFDQFIDVRTKSDEEVARLLNELQVDIAVDLMGHTTDARSNIFAFRPAPIQVSYLGFPGTMGADFIDYIIADPIVLPFDQQSNYVEKIVHLPDCYQVNDRKRSISPRAPTRAQAGLPAEAFVFCCFNNNWKITRAVFDVWMRLLQATEGSMLWLLSDNKDAESNLRKEAAARNIDAARLVFAGRVGHEDYLARFGLANLFLDTVPYNGHATASDALWAGLPVLTCRAQAFAGRVGASLLHAVGLPELVTDDLEAYERTALKLAAQPTMLAEIKARLVRDRDAHALFDTDRFRRSLEAAYLQMRDNWQCGNPPGPLAVTR
jgi:predicted O-linked N-acetylglucosamine transferase (SPINDLY family)